MESIHERNTLSESTNISCIRYRNLKNISHFHSEYELVYLNEGNAVVTVDENIFHLSTDQCVFIGGNRIHCIVADEHTIITVLKISSSFFEKRFSSRGLASPFIDNSSYVKGFLEQILCEVRHGSDFGSLMTDSMTTQLLVTLFRSNPTAENSILQSSNSKSHILYQRINRKIVTEYQSITFKEMAEYMHFSEPHFSKVFHGIFGVTFTQYLNTVKITAAIEKMKDTKMSMTEIALSCGFNTIRNFNRVFKNLTGFSPNTLPPDFVFLYRLQDGYGLDPTLSCTVILEE